MSRDDPGVPEAVPRVVRLLGRRLGPATIDRLWVFPPLKQGRRESGVVAASCFTEGEADEERRRLVTAGYLAERTGMGLTIDPVLREEGDAPPDVLPRIIAGVVSRAGLELGEPREVEIQGDSGHFEAFLDEFDPALLDEGEGGPTT